MRDTGHRRPEGDGPLSAGCPAARSSDLTPLPLRECRRAEDRSSFAADHGSRARRPRPRTERELLRERNETRSGRARHGRQEHGQTHAARPRHRPSDRSARSDRRTAARDGAASVASTSVAATGLTAASGLVGDGAVRRSGPPAAPRSTLRRRSARSRRVRGSVGGLWGGVLAGGRGAVGAGVGMLSTGRPWGHRLRGSGYVTTPLGRSRARHRMMSGSRGSDEGRGSSGFEASALTSTGHGADTISAGRQPNGRPRDQALGLTRRR